MAVSRSAFLPLALCAISIGGCGHYVPPPSPIMAEAVSGWQQMATDPDRARLRDWRKAWMEGLAGARASGSGPAIAAQGALFDPDRALDGAVPPAGRYRCRVFKLGANGTAMRAFTSYPDFACTIEDKGEVSNFTKLDGAQRPAGVIFHDSQTKAIFLGTLSLGDETSAMQYGRDHARDMAGFVERVGPNRWRLVLPYPAYESLIDVIELVPAAG